ncbi:unnamed protein product, partial [marine sediment metagenome]
MSLPSFQAVTAHVNRIFKPFAFQFNPLYHVCIGFRDKNS